MVDMFTFFLKSLKHRLELNLGYISKNYFIYCELFWIHNYCLNIRNQQSSRSHMCFPINYPDQGISRNCKLLAQLMAPWFFLTQPLHE